MGRAVEVRGEGDAVVVDSAKVRQREDLEAAGVGQDRSVPAHEPMQPAEAGDALGGRAQAQVIRVAEDHLRTGGAQVAGRQRLHRRLGPDRHELGRVDRAVGGRDPAEAGATDGGWLEREGRRQRGHGRNALVTLFGGIGAGYGRCAWGSSGL